MKVCILNLGLLLFGIGLVFHIEAQNIDNEYLTSLRQKYAWESIYLTYVPLSDLSQLLRDQIIINKLSQEIHGEGIAKLQRFLTGGDMGKIALLQINLMTLQAGFIKTDATNGVVTQVTWTQEEVFKVAYWCDRFLNDNALLTQIDQKIREGTISLKDAWNDIKKSQENPLIPQKNVVPVLQEFWYLVQAKQEEFLELKAQNNPLYQEIYAFDRQYYHRMMALAPTPLPTPTRIPTVIPISTPYQVAELQFPITAEEIIKALNSPSAQHQIKGIGTTKGLSGIVEDDTVLAEAPKVGAFITFEFDSDKIKSESIPLLQEYAEAFKNR